MTLRRVPPNLLVAQGATDFAFEQGMPVLPFDALISPSAKERWVRWQKELNQAERRRKASSTFGQIEKRTNPEIDDVQKVRRTHTKQMLGLSSSQNSTESLQQLCERTTDASPISHRSTECSSSAGSTTNPYTISVNTFEKERLSIQDHVFENFTHNAQRMSMLCSNHIKNESSRLATQPVNEEVDVINDGNSLHECEQRWHDGSDEDSSSHSSSTLQLPSLTPSPPTSPAAGAINADTVSGSDRLDLNSREMETAKKDGIMQSASSPKLSEADKRFVKTPFSAKNLEASVNSGNNMHLDQARDEIFDTVGAIAVDCYGNIACGASSGGIGMKYRGRVGPAALVGVGSAVIPRDPEDKRKTCVGVVTSGTGEHMATTMAAAVSAQRLYQSVRQKGFFFEHVDEDIALHDSISEDFMSESPNKVVIKEY
jgi:taspase, threonine aspartase, 1